MSGAAPPAPNSGTHASAATLTPAPAPPRLATNEEMSFASRDIGKGSGKGVLFFLPHTDEEEVEYSEHMSGWVIKQETARRDAEMDAANTARELCRLMSKVNELKEELSEVKVCLETADQRNNDLATMVAERDRELGLVKDLNQRLGQHLQSIRECVGGAQAVQR